MTQYFSAHAKERAWERYGLDLSAADMLEIVRACNDGRASLMQATVGGEVFVWSWRRIVILPVLNAGRNFILTFQPQDYFTKSGRAERLNKTQPKGAPSGASQAMGRGVDGRGDYNRARQNRRQMTGGEE